MEDLLIDGSLADIQKAYADRKLSVQEAVSFYLARIESFNHNGPKLNAVRTIAEDALEQARKADEGLRSGRDLGALHGIPVLLKDNILTGDGMPVSAGAAALGTFRAKADATIVTRLRQSGAIVLGKTNMTEFADYVSDVMPSAFSGAGGEVINPHSGPYGRGQGSSVGPASAVAASLAPVAIGSETQNSIQTPACASSVYGFKPSVGAADCTGIVPLVPSQDAPGPLARSVSDAARVSAILTGSSWDGRKLSIRDLRIGIPRRTIHDRADLATVLPAFDEAVKALAQAGAKIVDPCDIPSAEQLQDVRSSVFRTEFKAAINAFFTQHDAPCGVRSLADLIAWNEQHPDAIPYGQSLLLAAEATPGLSDPGYQMDRARDIVLSRTAGIDAAMGLGVDVLISPMSALAKCTGKAGSPVLALPIGKDAAGAPVGITLCTPLGSDSRLLQIGQAVADVVGQRILPSLKA